MERKEEKRYLIEVSEEQLRLIAECVEDCHRFACGQCELWNTASRMENFLAIKEGLEGVKGLVTPGLPFNASYVWSGGDCPNESQRLFIARTYPIYREILHFFAVESGIQSTYSSPTLTCGDGGEPIKISKK